MIIGVSVVRNESDIIEAMLRQNLFYLDRLIVIDNGSIDETPNIVSRLQAEGLSCELHADTRRNHQQHHILTEFIRETRKKYDAKRIIFLDADEFLCGDRHVFTDEMNPSHGVLHIPWKTYVPSPDDDPLALSVLSRIKHRREFESPQFSKVTLPCNLDGNIEVGRGSHSIRHDGQKVVGREAESVCIGHFPVRTPQQLLGKILLGSWNVRMRKHSMGEANHWMDLSREFQSHPDLDNERFYEIAAGYASDQKSALVLDPIEIQFDESLIEIRNLEDVLLRDIVQFTEHLVAQHGYEQTTRQKIGAWIKQNILRHFG